MHVERVGPCSSPSAPCSRRRGAGARQLGGAWWRPEHLVQESAVVLDDGGLELVIDEGEELEGEDVDDHLFDGAVLEYDEKVGEEDERVVEERSHHEVYSRRSIVSGGREFGDVR